MANKHNNKVIATLVLMLVSLLAWFYLFVIAVDRGYLTDKIVECYFFTVVPTVVLILNVMEFSKDYYDIKKVIKDKFTKKK